MRKVVFVLVAVLSGCNCSPAQGGDGGSPDSGTPPADSGTPPDAGAPDAGPSTYTVALGPIAVDGGDENTQCIVVDVGNAAPVHIGEVQSQLSGDAYQMALYKVGPTAPQPTPFDCTALGGVGTSTDTALIVTKNAIDSVTLPTGTAFSFSAHQMVRMELHFANPGLSPGDAGASVALTTSPDSQFQSEAALLWVDDATISIPPNGTASITPFIALPPSFATARFFAFSGDEHHLGTMMKLSSAATAQDTGTLLYTSTFWNNAPTTPVTPAPVPTDGGFKFECDWNNNTPNNVTAGTNSLNEACNFAAYFSPAIDAGTPRCVLIGAIQGCTQ